MRIAVLCFLIDNQILLLEANESDHEVSDSLFKFGDDLNKWPRFPKPPVELNGFAIYEGFLNRDLNWVGQWRKLNDQDKLRLRNNSTVIEYTPWEVEAIERNKDNLRINGNKIVSMKTGAILELSMHVLSQIKIDINQVTGWSKLVLIVLGFLFLRN